MPDPIIKPDGVKLTIRCLEDSDDDLPLWIGEVCRSWKSMRAALEYIAKTDDMTIERARAIAQQEVK